MDEVEVLGTFEYLGDRTAVAYWAAGLRGEWTPFDWCGPAGELCLSAGAQDTGRVQPGQYIAAVRCAPDVWSPSGVRFVKAGAWTYGDTLTGPQPATADWPGEAFRHLVERHCSEVDQVRFLAAQEQAERLFDRDDGQDDRIIAIDDGPSLHRRARTLLAQTPLVPGKGYLLRLPDHRGRLVEFWLRWDAQAVPGELLEQR